MTLEFLSVDFPYARQFVPIANLLNPYRHIAELRPEALATGLQFYYSVASTAAPNVERETEKIKALPLFALYRASATEPDKLRFVLVHSQTVSRCIASC